MEIFVSAGEASSDIHCARVIRELKQLAAQADPRIDLKVFGLGGDQLAAEGAVLLMHNHEFSVGGGPLEVISKWPLRSRLERILEKRFFAGKRPDGAILVDNGEINLRLASLLHFFGVPVVYFIPPKVWVWRHSRIELIAHHVDLVLSILPFEEPIYKDWNIPFRYVGNPLVDEVPADLSQQEAKSRLGIKADTDVLAVLPGSRHNEVRYQAPLFSEAIRLFFERLPSSEPKPVVVIPAAQAIEVDALKAIFPDALVVKGMSHECLKAARAALVKSGTSTLEAALLGTPMVLAYHSSRSAEWVYRHIVRYRGFVGLVNLFHAKSADAALGWAEPETPLVPELILERCTPARVAVELKKIYEEGPARESMQAALSRTRGLLLPADQGSPLKEAARASFDVFVGKAGVQRESV